MMSQRGDGVKLVSRTLSSLWKQVKKNGTGRKLGSAAGLPGHKEAPEPGATHQYDRRCHPVPLVTWEGYRLAFKN